MEHKDDTVTSPPTQSSDEPLQAHVVENPLALKLRVLLEGIEPIFTNKKCEKHHYLKLFTIVYDHCNTYCPPPPLETDDYASDSYEYLLEIKKSRNLGIDVTGSEVYEAIEMFLKKIVSKIRDLCVYKEDEDFLIFYGRQWKDYRKSCSVLNGICNNLNIYWVPRAILRQYPVYTIYRLALKTWKEYLFTDVYKEKITNVLLMIFNKQRNGYKFDTKQFFNTIDCCRTMGLLHEDLHFKGENLSEYKSVIEDPFYSDTETFFMKETDEYLEKHSFYEYLHFINKRIKEETIRIQLCFHPSSWQPMHDLLDRIFIVDRWPLFLNHFNIMLVGNQIDNLKIVYQLITSRMPHNMYQLRDVLEACMLDEVNSSLGVMKKDDVKTYVRILMDIFTKYKYLLTDAFGLDSGFVKSVQDAYSKCVNSNVINKTTPGTSAKLVAKYCHQLLKKDSKIYNEAEFKDKIVQIMMIFEKLHDKDIFQDTYDKWLSNRLMCGQEGPEHAENLMITKLTNEHSPEYTKNFESMIGDMNVAKAFNELFKENLKKSNDVLFDFNVFILCTRFWQHSKLTSIMLPSILDKAIIRFGEYYKVEHKNNKFKWIWKMSRGELVTNCFKKEYTMLGNTYQMVVLLQYNDSTSFTVRQLCENTKIIEEDMLDILRNILKNTVLTCSDKPNKLHADSTLYLNMKLNKNNTIFNLNVTFSSDMKKEQIKTPEDMEKTRKFVTQAGIVRIMKKHKVMQVQELVDAVLKEITNNFRPTEELINTCINQLIEKEYLTLNKETDTLNYCD